MVAALAPAAAHNVVRKSARNNANKQPVVDARKAPRARVALQAWLCVDEGSKRGYALDVSAHGARFGGMGVSLEVGARVIAKIMLDLRDPPLVIAAEVVRYAPTSGACPELCVRFDQDAPVDELFRLARFVDGLRN